MTNEVNGKAIDLEKALPLTMRDIVLMEKKGFRSDAKEAPFTNAMIFISYMIQKANPQVTEDDVLGLQPTDPIIVQILKWMREGAPGPNNPPGAVSSA